MRSRTASGRAWLASDPALDETETVRLRCSSAQSRSMRRRNHASITPHGGVSLSIGLGDRICDRAIRYRKLLMNRLMTGSADQG